MPPAPAVADPQAAGLALRVVCRATYVPRAARQLAEASGVVPWLASAAVRCLQQAQQAQQQPLAQLSSSGPGPAEALGWAREALEALLRLTRIRAVARLGARGVQEDLSAAVRQVAAALGMPQRGPSQAPEAAVEAASSGGGGQTMQALLLQLSAAVERLQRRE